MDRVRDHTIGLTFSFHTYVWVWSSCLWSHSSSLFGSLILILLVYCIYQYAIWKNMMNASTTVDFLVFAAWSWAFCVKWILQRKYGTLDDICGPGSRPDRQRTATGSAYPSTAATKYPERFWYPGMRHYLAATMLPCMSLSSFLTIPCEFDHTNYICLCHWLLHRKIMLLYRKIIVFCLVETFHTSSLSLWSCLAYQWITLAGKIIQVRAVLAISRYVHVILLHAANKTHGPTLFSVIIQVGR